MQKRTMLSKNAKIEKREWEGNDYSPITSEKDIERALREEYSRFDSLVKLEYVGTDWEMGSQYWVALFKKSGGNSEHFPYACVTVIDWTYDNPQRGIISDGYVDGELDEMKSAYQHKVDSLKSGTRKSMMKSKSMRKGADSIAKDNVSSIERKVTEICDLTTAISRYCGRRGAYTNSALAEIEDACNVVIERMRDFLPDDTYEASAKKSKRELLKAKVDELLDEEDDDEIAKPRMKDMFLDSKRKSRKSTKSNDEKGEDADEYREESAGDDVSDSKVMKPEDANDNEDENEAPSGGNSSLPEDADGQENQSAKRKKTRRLPTWIPTSSR